MLDEEELLDYYQNQLDETIKNQCLKVLKSEMDEGKYDNWKPKPKPPLGDQNNG